MIPELNRLIAQSRRATQLAFGMDRVAAMPSGLSNWTARGFDDELLMTFARARPKAILLQLIMLMPILGISAFSPPLMPIPFGAFLIGVGLAASLILADYWPKFLQLTAKLLFISFEALQGTGWALIS